MLKLNYLKRQSNQFYYIKNRVVSYWTRLMDNININETTKLSSKLYIVLRELQDNNLVKSLWIENVKQYLC
jgi:hypothetical protein